MVYIQLLLLLLHLAHPPYIRAGDSKDNELVKIMSMVSELTEAVRAQGERIEEQQEDIRYLRKSLDKRLRENDLKIEWALTDGTLAPKNTSGIMEKIDESLDVLKEIHGYTCRPGSCADIEDGGASGVHSIYPNKAYSPVKAWCENSDGGGWTVIQKRFNGSVDFFRGWEEYAEGFGNPAGEYWLGLRHIHAMTQAQQMTLFIGVTDFDTGLRYCKYGSFAVTSEDDKFRLQIANYTGHADDDVLLYYNGKPFSTKDVDNDQSDESCSITRHGAWWYHTCSKANLNGRFSNVKIENKEYMWWNYGKNKYKAMKASVMMMRPSNFEP